MTTEPTPVIASPESRLSQTANNLVMWLARHWLFIFNTAWAMYVIVPFLAPIMMQVGWTTPASILYRIYSLLCHQLPTHSYFLFGSEHAPEAATLIAGGMTTSSSLFAQRAFIGNQEVGWKVAICERDVAIYVSVFVSGLLYALVRKRVRPLSFKVYVLFLIPIAIDGLTQLFGWRESTWWLRTITGALFGFGSVWLAYPYVEEAMQEVLESEIQRHGDSTSPR